MKFRLRRGSGCNFQQQKSKSKNLTLENVDVVELLVVVQPVNILGRIIGMKVILEDVLVVG